MLHFCRRILIPAAMLFFLVFLFSPSNLIARSGCCSRHGGVCGCGCCDGTALSSTCAPYYPQCSQPASVAPIKTSTPIVYTPKPTIKAFVTITPSPTKKPTLSPTLIPSTTPTVTPQVQEETKEVTTDTNPTSSPKPLTTGGAIGVLGFLIAIIGLPIWIVIKIIKKFRKPKTVV